MRVDDATKPLFEAWNALQAESRSLLLAATVLENRQDDWLEARQKEQHVIVATLAKAAAESDLAEAQARLREARQQFQDKMAEAPLDVLARFIASRDI